MRFVLFALAPMMFFGCETTEDETGPVDMSEAFPVGGNSSWEFLNANATVSYTLIGSLAQDRTDESLYTIKYVKHCMAVDETCVEGELVRSLTLSNDANNGVLIHGTNDAGIETVYEPPLTMAAAEMYQSDQMITQTAGFTWTSTLVATEECPVVITGGIAEQCVRISLSDGGMGETNSGLVGEYWATAGYGIVAMDVASDEGRWELRDYAEGEDTL